jgi:anti-sigma-K factor RskA
MTMMDPAVHALTGAYACDALEPAERAVFEEHMALCPTCRQEVAELTETVARLGMAVAEEPPARLKASVDAQIGRTRQLAPAAGAATPSRERRRWSFTTWLGWGVATAMAGVVAVLGVHVTDQQNRLDQARRQSSAMSDLLTAPDARSSTALVRTGGHAIVLASRSRDEAAITVSDLTAAPAGRSYQLWMIGPGGIRSGGLLPTTSQGTSGSVIAHGLGDAQTIGLTVEPVGGSAQPTTTPVLLLPMPA